MYFEIDGANINYALDGPEHAPLVVHWNGANCALGMWDEAIPRINGHFRSLRFDARGIGSSSPASNPDTDYTFERYVADVNAIVDSLGVEKYHLWSMAWGSRAAIAYCSKNVGRVNNAVLHDASMAKADPTTQKEGAKVAVEKQISQGIKKFEKPANYNLNHQPELVPSALAAAAGFDLSSAINQLSLPVLLVTGDHDPNLASSREINKTLVNSSLLVLENVGHGSVLQRPDLCINSFRQFQLAQKQS